jgi:hypothetical protein
MEGGKAIRNTCPHEHLWLKRGISDSRLDSLCREAMVISWTKYHTNILKRVETSNRQTVLIMGMSQGSFDTKVAKVVHKEIYGAITPKYNPAVVNYESYLSLMLNKLVTY